MAMTQAEMAYQATLYCLVSRLLSYPEDARAQEACACELAGLFEEGCKEHELLADAQEAARQAGTQRLQVDYTALFIGSFEMLAVPYASYYLDGEHRLGGVSMREIERAYAKCGLVLDQAHGRKQPGDHIATLCEFLFVLLRDAASADAQGARRSELVGQARDFFACYVLPWVRLMADSVARHAQTDFYRNVGKLLPLVLVEDSLLLER